MFQRRVFVGINNTPGCPLFGCIKDVRRSVDGFTRLYRDDPQGYRLLMNERATKENMLTRFKWAAMDPRPGAVPTIQWSCHGYTYPARFNDEIDRVSEGVFPYDGSFDDEETLLSEDELQEEVFAHVPNGNRLVIFADSCYSYGVGRGQYDPHSRPRPKSVEVPEDIAFRYQLAGRKGILVNRLRNAVGAYNVVLLAAAAENEPAMDGLDGGVFTTAVWHQLEATPFAPLTEVIERISERVTCQKVGIYGPEDLCKLPLLPKP